jgi:hypothetical protein
LLNFVAVGCAEKKDGVPTGIDAAAIREYEKQDQPDLYKDYVPPAE